MTAAMLLRPSPRLASRLALAAVGVAVGALLSCEGSERTRDTRILYEAILAEYAAQDEVLCPCEVAEGKYASVAECEARHAVTDAQRECIHAVLKEAQDLVVESLWCTLDAEEALSACARRASCANEPRLDCAIAYAQASSGCALPSEVAVTIEVECYGEPPLTCMDGQVIVKEMICDGKPDCADKSDEQDCPGRYMCADGTSVPEAWACDGEADCPDRSDETRCGGFKCKEGPIPAEWVCDGEPDCADGADEAGC